MSIVALQDKFTYLGAAPKGYELTYWLAYRPDVQTQWVVPATGATLFTGPAADGSWTRDYTADLPQGTVLAEVFTRTRADGERTRTATFWAVDAPASAPPRRVVITLTPVDWKIGRLYERSDVPGQFLYIDWEFHI